MKEWNEMIRIVLQESNADGADLFAEKFGIEYTGDNYRKFAAVMRNFLRKFGEPDEIMQLTKITPGGETWTRKSTEEKPDGGIPKRWTSNPYGGAWVKYEAEGFDFSKIEELLKNAVQGISYTPKPFRKVESEKVIIAIYTDAHVAMETNSDGHSLYGGEWNKNKLEERMTDFAEDVKRVSKGKETHIFDLGDYMDGWDGLTSRKGHDLPQNMDNEKAFMVGVRAKLMQCEILPDAKFHNVTNDNHSFHFGKIVNRAVQMMAGDDRYKLYHKFINHIVIGNHCFIFSHGKDAKNLKFGFSVQLDAKSKAKIEEYIDFHKLHKYHCTFIKGDSHQKLFDDTSYKFRYYNYPALSPASEWVQTNYSKGRSGYVIHEIDKDSKEIRTLVSKEYDWE